eukprot:g54242.t1
MEGILSNALDPLDFCTSGPVVKPDLDLQEIFEPVSKTSLAVLRNEFEKICRARITLGRIAEELREYRAKNIVGKAEPAGGWGDLKDPDTNKKIICTSRGEYNLECYLPDVVGSSTRGILDAIANGLLVAVDNLMHDVDVDIDS